MLEWLKGLVPFVLMTATFSETMLTTLARKLDAEIVTLTPEELLELESEQKDRFYHTASTELSPKVVLDAHQERSIVVFNTVGRAQKFYRELRAAQPVADGDIEVCLLHSRFTRDHRRAKENWVRREFGEDTGSRQARSAILVATQVIEVGLDITCQNLHTELAEANSLIQRAGRAARYKGEVGNVYIYRPTSPEDGSLQAQPYRKNVMEQTWTAFSQVSGQKADYSIEKGLVDTVHQESDRALLETLHNSQPAMAKEIKEVMLGQERTEARRATSQLIRDVQNVTVVIHPDPKNAKITQPWALEGFSLFTYTLRNPKRIAALLDRAKEQGLLDSGMWVCEPKEDKTETIWTKPEYVWKEVSGVNSLAGHSQVFIHPALAAYDAELGFRLLIEDFADEPPGTYQADISVANILRREKFGYKKETYQTHISNLLGVYTQSRGSGSHKGLLTYQDEMKWITNRLESHLTLPVGTVDRAIRLACACHDLGKMTEEWQGWAHNWQKQVKPVTYRRTEMLARTDFDPHNPVHEELAKQTAKQRPPHAVQGAFAAQAVAKQVLGDDRLQRAVVTAIARHHSADALSSEKAYRLHTLATPAMRDVFGLLAGHDNWQVPTDKLIGLMPAGINLAQLGCLSRNKSIEEVLLYYLIVRVVRLCDVEASEFRL
jgi:CRISPR-associated endonuclease/helicase Cas3